MSGTNTPEYKTFFRNQAKIADTISDINGLIDRIVAELYARRIVGKAVRDAADIRGPQVPEIQRVRPVVNAIIARIKGDKNMYYRVRDVLLSDDIIVDAPELAQYLPQGIGKNYVCTHGQLIMTPPQGKKINECPYQYLEISFSKTCFQ